MNSAVNVMTGMDMQSKSNGTVRFFQVDRSVNKYFEMVRAIHCDITETVFAIYYLALPSWYRNHNVAWTGQK